MQMVTIVTNLFERKRGFSIRGIFAGLLIKSLAYCVVSFRLPRPVVIDMLPNHHRKDHRDLT